MREILFRGKWRNKEWVYGNYEYYHKPEKHIISDFYTQDTYGIDKNTLGQYAGLVDKNGTKIFEGDIVECKVAGEEIIAIIEWSNIKALFQIRKPNDVIAMCSLYHIYDIKVIGNIYDNPELLEVNK